MKDRALLLKNLRALLLEKKLDGVLISMGDPFCNEYVDDAFNRIQFITGFTGSAGWLWITNQEAIFVTDGRYTIQAKKEIDPSLFAVKEGSFFSLKKLLNPSKEFRMGFDPWTLTVSQLRHLEALECSWIPLDHNFVDILWIDRPKLPQEPLILHEKQFAGESSEEKRKKIAAILSSRGMNSFLFTTGDSLCWLLNVRGGDVKNTPFPFAYGILHTTGAFDLFIDPTKVSQIVKNHLGPQVQIHPLDTLKEIIFSTKRMGIDEHSTPVALYQLLDKSEWIKEDNPCLLPKACKNETEIEGASQTHFWDGLAVTRFLFWLDQQESVTEWEASEKLESLRIQAPYYQGPSFDTISGSGPNGVLCHYRPSESCSKHLQKGDLYLVDSGGQYKTGTTDVTRTIIFGGVSTAQQRDHYTRVLKGHIALAMARFPKGTSGGQLDALARQFLWEQGLDYAHGTGHGVGSYLSVHEGPQSISPRGYGTPLMPGMLVTNEPGFYLENHYGIRLENIMLVKESSNFQNFLEFEVLTLVPFDGCLIHRELLTESEQTWLMQYHGSVEKSLKNHLSPQEFLWLQSTKKA